MFSIVIFLPKNDILLWKGFVYGIIEEFNSGIAIYVLGYRDGEIPVGYEIVGHFGPRRRYRRQKKDNFVSIIVNEGQVEEVHVHNERNANVISVVLFDKQFIQNAQLFEKIPRLETDYIYRLVKEVNNEYTRSCLNNNSNPYSHSYFLKVASLIVNTGLAFFNYRWIAKCVKISSFGLYVKNTFEVTDALLEDFIEHKRFTVETVNYLWARLSDAILGVLIMFLVTSYTSSNDIFDGLTHFQEYIVVTLETTVEWLMGSPAGFKLNYPLNNILGPFYQFHIALWGTFLKLCNPILRTVFHVLLVLGCFGFSFQVAILADILAVVSVHMYCIYVYASRIHLVQIEGLKVLSRLFIGKKRKPLPGKTQALPYTTEQLLFGTVSFTILLFLLPTTLIYYFVFTMIRIILIFIGGILTCVRHVMSVFPIYVTWLWFFDPILLTCAVRLSTNTMCWNDGTLVSEIKPVCKSWVETVCLCIPRNLNRPEDIQWKKLTTNVLVGNLIYPV